MTIDGINFLGYDLSQNDIIIISSVGAFLVILLIILFACCICRCHKKAKEKKMLDAEKKINENAKQKLDPNLKKSQKSKAASISVTM